MTKDVLKSGCLAINRRVARHEKANIMSLYLRSLLPKFL